MAVVCWWICVLSLFCYLLFFLLVLHFDCSSSIHNGRFGCIYFQFFFLFFIHSLSAVLFVDRPFFPLSFIFVV